MFTELTKRIFSSAILIPIIIYVIIEGSMIFILFLILCFFILSYEWSMMIKSNFLKILGIIFILISLFTIYKIRINPQDSYWFLLLITIICISTDIGGYIFGKILKGPKLTKISPNKTYWGMLGSFILSFITAYVYFYNFAFTSISDLDRQMEFKIITIVLSVSLVSQVGDLIISFFKRKSRIKNTGKIIPGHGGILDRIDGMIFAFPYAFLLTKFVL